MFRSSLSSLALLATGAFAATVTKQLTIANAELSPDGFKRIGTLVNGQFPAPLITANKGDEFEIEVIDNLTYDQLALETSIHWHGLFQKGTAEMDGVAQVGQCPIVPGNRFTYKFATTTQTGNYWYHSHYSTQYCDGLRGPLVIYDPEDPLKHLYDVDNEDTVITLADWYHFLSPQFPNIVYANSTLINGAGRYHDFVGQDFSHALAVVNVEKGTRYRMRLFNIACDPNFIFSIDQHQMTVIEADGGSLEPLLVDSIQIFAGQRYSFVLNANQPIDNYWIRSLPNSSSENFNNENFTNGLNSAILRYKGAKEQDPTTPLKPSVLPLIETNLHPLVPSPPPAKADTVIRLPINLVLNNTANTGTFFINGTSFVPPKIPVLLQLLAGNTTTQDLIPKGSIYTLEPNTTIDLVVPGGSLGGPHPMHLHGHQFWVIRSAGNSSENIVNPVLRDVVSVGNSTTDEVTIRFRTDNPGPWIFHCHIDWHLAEGLAVVFAEDPKQVAAANHVDASYEALCPAYDKFLAANPGAF
ncbi:unnamed protein product [Peniophora sp. CBMAI 1063]|nr:unnamed protein product [Peniophora sp. CBMAI 1063]